MRKILFAAVVSSVVLAVAPATAFARSHHHRGHHRSHRTHARVRDEHLGSWNDANPAPNSAQNAGKVASFNNGTLTLILNDGSMVSGQVTDATEIKCETAEPQELEHSEHADGDHAGGSNGGGDENGDNNGNNDDQGEDEQGAPMCSTANLVPGTVVRDAELTISGIGATWKEVSWQRRTSSRNLRHSGAP
jgi:hypothetical protein